MVFAHGFGCDQTMWRLVAPAFEDRFRVVLFDHAGSRANPGEYDADRHASLDGYTEDVLAILDGLDLHDVIFVGHSVSAMIGVLAAKQDPGRFAQLVLVGPSPRYINDDGYVGGFDRQDIDELLANLEANYLGWSSAMAPVIMGNLDQPALGEELTASFCATDPRIARQFAEVTFTSDNRADLPGVNVPVLVLQCAERRDRSGERRRIRRQPDARCVARSARRDRALSAPQCARSDDRRHQRLRRHRGLRLLPVPGVPGFESLFHSAPCGYLVTAPAGDILLANETILAWLGYAEERARWSERS